MVALVWRRKSTTIPCDLLHQRPSRIGSGALCSIFLVNSILWPNYTRSDNAKNGDAMDKSFGDASLFFFLLNDNASERYEALSDFWSSGLFFFRFFFVAWENAQLRSSSLCPAVSQQRAFLSAGVVSSNDLWTAHVDTASNDRSCLTAPS